MTKTKISSSSGWKGLITLLISVFFPSLFFAQGTNIKFKHISIKEGLSQSTINAVTQDQMGFMWFGTQDGLNKFDGYDFTIYKNEVDDSSSISSGYINCFYNDNAGHLWIGTNSGVNVFHHNTNSFIDLTSEFPELLSLKDESIIAINRTSDSTYWIATINILYRFTIDGKLIKINIDCLSQAESISLKISDIEIVSPDHIWVSSRDQGIFDFNLNTGVCARIQSGLPDKKNSITSNEINKMFKSSNGLIYIGTANGMTIYEPTGRTFSSFLFNEANPFSISSNFITDVYEDHLGNIWIGTTGGGLNKFLPLTSSFYTYKKSVNNESTVISNDITCVYQDNSGVMWVGTSVGLSKFDLLKQNFNHFEFDQNSISSISRNIVWSILSEDNIIWVGTNEGLNKYHRNKKQIESFTPKILINNEHRTNSIYALLNLNSDKLLLGTDGGVYEFDKRSNKFNIFQLLGIRISSRAYSFLQDSQKRLWVACREGLHMFDTKNGIHRLYNQSTGLPGDIVRKVIEASDNSIWVGTDNGLCHLKDVNETINAKVYVYEKSNPNSLRNNTILTIAEDSKGFIWIGTFGGGLNRLDPRTEQFLSYSEKDGLPNNVIYGILLDEKNNLWCSTNNGLSQFNSETKSVRNFDEYDGLQSNEFNVGAYFQDESGELFFGGIKGVNSFFPSQIQINKLPPHLVLTDFQLFNQSVKVEKNGVLEKSISVTKDIILSSSQNIFTFSFSALHYSLPERNRYAYKLEGFDPNWIFDDNTRRAKYTNLDPGKYTFKVKGTNSDGIWSDEVSVDIIIKPPLWRIWWIQLIAFLILAGSIFLFYRNRLKIIQSQKDKLEKEVVLRTLEVRDQKEEIEKQKLLLEDEKEKLETLLLNVLPESTVEELKMKGKATARNYNKSTVMFTDFKGFTKISESLTPTELVEKLDSFFVRFDEIIEKYNVEKIKTIGDAYMCAGGIPIRNKSNPIDVVLAALNVQRIMEEFNEELRKKGEPEWGLRLGIHTGAIIAGVIGIKRFAYDIWGDTVNVASRIETNGEVGKVNVSEATYEEVKDFFECEYRGKIYAKNKGEIDMYFINKIKNHLSIDGKGIEPNETFWEFVNLTLFSPIEYHKAETSILNKLRENLPADLYYHDVDHTIGVCAAVERIALKEGINNEDLYALKMAALYHDAGFVEKYQNNETIGAKMAREDLVNYGFNDDQIDLIEKLIMITFANRKPESKLEKILRDADLDYLGRDDFHDISDKLKRELMDRKMVRSDDHWDEMQISFLEKHQYFTETAKIERDEKKYKHLEEIKARVLKKIKNSTAN